MNKINSFGDFLLLFPFIQETIAASEYMRALKFMKEGHNDEALSLLTELLEAKVIFEVSTFRGRMQLHACDRTASSTMLTVYSLRGSQTMMNA